MSHPNPERERVVKIRERRRAMEQFGNLVVSNTPGSHRLFVIVAGTIGLEANCGVDGERNRAKAEFFANAPSDIDHLLSLLDSQAANLRLLRIASRAAIHETATAMRDRCVAKVKEISATKMARYEEFPDKFNHLLDQAIGLDEAVAALESLTLDQVEQEKSKKGKQEQWATIICPTCNHDVTTNAPEALLKKINSALARERKEARAAAFKEMFKVLCPDCAEGDCPVFDRQARWYYHGEMHGTVGCSASKLRIEAAANAEEGAGDG